MDGTGNGCKGWRLCVAGAGLFVAFCWFVIMGSTTCRHCYESVWDLSEARAGLIFVFFGMVRICEAGFAGRRFNWLACSLVCLSSPAWIHFVFGVVLRLGTHLP